MERVTVLREDEVIWIKLFLLSASGRMTVRKLNAGLSGRLNYPAIHAGDLGEAVVEI
jgi:hypothetical protein